MRLQNAVIADPHRTRRHPAASYGLCSDLAGRSHLGDDVGHDVSVVLVEVERHRLALAVLLDCSLPGVRMAPVLELVPLRRLGSSALDLDHGIVGELKLDGVGGDLVSRLRGLAVLLIFLRRPVPTVLSLDRLRGARAVRGQPGIGALELAAAACDGGQGTAHGPCQVGFSIRCRLVLPTRVADLSTGAALVAPDRELPLLQIVHAHVEELDVRSRPAKRVFGIDAQVHVPIIGGVVVPDVQSLGRGEQLCEVLGRRRAEIQIDLVPDLELGHIVLVVVPVQLVAQILL